jgi:hypothetical protein
VRRRFSSVLTTTARSSTMRPRAKSASTIRASRAAASTSGNSCPSSSKLEWGPSNFPKWQRHGTGAI